MSYEGGSSKGRLDIQKKPRIKKRLSNQVPTKFPKAHDDRVSNPIYQKGRGNISSNKKSSCGKCGRRIMLIGLLGETIALVVARVDTRLGIDLM